MKIATWNVNSVGARLPLVVRWLRERQPDVLCLQETKCTNERFPHSTFAELGYTSESFGQRTYNGVAILARASVENVQRGFGDDIEDAQSRLIAGTIGGVRIVNVYVPNGQSVGSDKYLYKLAWFDRLREFFETRYGRDEPVLLCGDFNVAPEDRDVHDPQLWRGRVLVSAPERAALDEIKEWGFVDAFRQHTSASGHYTWWDYRGGSFRSNEGLRIDHILTTEPLAARSTHVWIDIEPRRWERPSDHALVIAEFEEFSN